MNTTVSDSLDALVANLTTSEPEEKTPGWIQPSATKLVLIGQPVQSTGELIDNVYLVPGLDVVDDDDGEMDGLVAAYAEAKSIPSDPISLEEAIADLAKLHRKA